MVNRNDTAGYSPAPAPAKAVATEKIAPVRRRRSPGLIFGAIALTITGGVVSALLFLSASNSEDVFVVARDVARGETIEADDLTTLSISEGQTGAGITIDRVDSVVGQVAIIDLPEGSLVTNGAFAEQLSVPAGQALVGLSLTAAQMPSQRMLAGQEILIVPIANSNAAPVDGSNEVSSVPATVSAVRGDSATGTTIVDVYVSETRAADVASRAAAATVAIYLAPSEG